MGESQTVVPLNLAGLCLTLYLATGQFTRRGKDVFRDHVCPTEIVDQGLRQTGAAPPEIILDPSERKTVENLSTWA